MGKRWLPLFFKEVLQCQHMIIDVQRADMPRRSLKKLQTAPSRTAASATTPLSSAGREEALAFLLKAAAFIRPIMLTPAAEVQKQRQKQRPGVAALAEKTKGPAPLSFVC